MCVGNQQGIIICKYEVLLSISIEYNLCHLPYGPTHSVRVPLVVNLFNHTDNLQVWEYKIW